MRSQWCWAAVPGPAQRRSARRAWRRRMRRSAWSGGCGWLNDAHRRGLRRPAGHPQVPSHLETQLRPVGVANVDDLTVVDVDHRHPAPIDVSPVQRPVVDSQPAALFEAQQQMSTRNQWMCDAHIGAEITSDDHVVARGKGTLRSVVPNCQHGRCCLTHRPNCSCLAHRIDCIGCGAVGFQRHGRLRPGAGHARRSSSSLAIARLLLTPLRGLYRRRALHRRRRGSRRSGCGYRSSACTGCSACTPNARRAGRRPPAG
jgi:hypothetical protein